MPFLSIANFYFILWLPFLIGWLLLFFFNKETRREQLRMSIARKDLIFPSVMSGLLFMAFVFSAYTLTYYSFPNVESGLSRIWYLYQTPLGARLLHIPITELVWSFSVGTSIGIFSQYTSGSGLVGYFPPTRSK